MKSAVVFAFFKNSPWPRSILLLVASLLAVPSPAQAANEPPSGNAAQAMQEALALRSEAAGNVAAGTESLAHAIDRLKAHGRPSGLEIDADADFAHAAIDVGRRLLVLAKPAHAEEFFRAAEESLDRAIARTPDTAAKDKAGFLEAIAIVRTEYLNKAEQGKRDIEAALKLQPDDKGLKRTAEKLRTSQGARMGGARS